MNTTSIEWVRRYHADGSYIPGFSSNPIRARAIDPRTGRLKTYHHCTKQGPECDHCYAETLNLRWGTGRTYTADNDGAVEWVLDEREFAAWHKAPPGSAIFVEDMSDLFHRGVPAAFLDRVGAEIADTPDVIKMLLTKRAQRGSATVNQWVAQYGPLPHLYFGVSIGTQQARWRARYLGQVAGVGARFISNEPSLERVDFRPVLGLCVGCQTCWYEDGAGLRQAPHRIAAPQVDWIITGGESGAHHRPFHGDWARAVRDACQAAGVPWFFKQHGGRTPKAGGRLLDGRTWDEQPQVAA